MRPAHNENSRLLTLGKSPHNEVFGFAADRPYGGFAVYNLYNPRYDEDDHRSKELSKPELVSSVSIDFAEAGIPTGENVAVFDFWENKVVAYAKDSYTTEELPGQDSRLLRFTALTEAKADIPVLVGSNLHLAMGATEIADIRATSAGIYLELTDAGAQEGSLTLYSKAALTAGAAENCEITSVEDLGDNLWRVNLAGRLWGKPQSIQLDAAGAAVAAVK